MLNRYLYLMAVVVLFLSAPTFHVQSAGILSDAIAHSYVIEDEGASSGDIIAFGEAENSYRLAVYGDTQLVGVVVSDPLIVVETEATGTPVVQNGEVMVHVSTENGNIDIGDLIGLSSIPGVGSRTTNTAEAVGIAQRPFSAEEATDSTEVNGETIHIGSIRVLLDVSSQSGVVRAAQSDSPLPGGPIPQSFKYVMALLIGVGSVYLSFRNFGANIKNGILSIGRNPLARRSIQAMVLLNIVLIVLVAGGGLLLSIAILLLPF